MTGPFTTEPVFGLAYNLLFEQEQTKNPTLTAVEFNKWLHTQVNAKAAQGKK